MREGYKKTEIGIIPEDWEVKNLIDAVDKNDRYSFTGGPFGSDLKSCHYTEDGVRVIQLQNIGDGYLNDDYKIYTSVEKADELKGCNIYPGDIIIAKMAEPVARACMIPEKEERYLMCSDGIRLNVDCSEYDKNYILYSINSSYFRKSAEANSTGSTRLRIGLSQLKELKIIKPPLKEQEKIAEILSTVDSQIDDTEKLIEKSKELKKGLMQKLLTKGIGHSEFKKTEVGEIPVSWEVKNLGDISIEKGKYGIGAASVEFIPGKPRYLRITDIGDSSNLLYNDIKGFDDNDYRQYILNEGDIVFARTGNTTGKSYVYNKSDGELVYAGFLIKFKINPKIANYNFVKYIIQTKRYWDWVNVMSTRSGQPGINSNEYCNLKIQVPSLDEQNKIANILLLIDKKIEEYENKKQKLEELKKGLMQQLLTGKIRTV